ncbi:MAG: discoidin domain-containing protein [Phycisphaerae bacterium]|nr:discoidin domain-containing protein [Phycisphaerae bacterium]
MCKKLMTISLLALVGLAVVPVDMACAEDFVAREEGANILFRQTDGQVVWTSTEGLDGTPTLIQVGPDGNVYISTSNNQDCKRWDGATGEYLGMNIENIGHRLYGICFGSDIDGDGIEDLYTFGGAAAVVNSYTSSSDYTEQGSWVATVTTGAWAGDFGPDVNGDGVQELYVLPELLQNLNNQLTVIDGATAAELYTFAIPLVNRPGCLVAGSDGRIYITGRNNDVIVSYLPDGTDPQTHVTGEGSNFSTQIAEGKAGEWYIANRFNVTGLPADAGSIVISTDNFATTSVLIAGTEAADLYNGIASFDSAGIVEGPATAPNPGNNATDVLRDGVLSWTSGPYAVEHQVFFGDSFEDVDSATVPASSGQDVTSFDPGRLDFGKTYFWRVDEVNGTPDRTVYKGDVWSFEVEPYSLPIPGSSIAVTASSSSNEFSIPENTVNGSGLDTDTGAHGIALETMWFTATEDPAPWIQFEFDDIKQLDTMKVWNSNSAAEVGIGWGVKDVEIATSADGDTWTVADANQFSRAPGLPSYNQFDTIALAGVAAKYVKLNIKSNWGGVIESYGLSEVQFSAIPAAVRTPEPASGAVNVQPNATATWRAGRHAAKHIVYVSQDAKAVMDGSAQPITTTSNEFNLSEFDLHMGQTYYWRVDEVNEAEAVPVWTGPVWSLSIVSAITVEDFEGYSNLSPNRPFQTWLDGFGYSADAFFPVDYGGNGTGSGIGHDIWSPSSVYFDGTLMEKGNTIPGSSQSMPFYYTNANGVVSQTERTFAQPQDWTIGGAKTMSINFFGQAGNTGTLYVKINNNQITYPHDAANMAKESWQAWNIDLSSMNVQAVTKLQIGVEGAGTSGMILIDDIKLYPTAGERLTPVAPTSDNLVGAWKFDEGSGTVAVDSSGNGHNGTIIDGTWQAGPEGSALVFNGITSKVTLPAAAWESIEQQVTVSLWAYMDSSLVQTPVTFAAYQDLAINNSRVISTHIIYSGTTLYFDAGGDAGGYDRISAPASAGEYGDAWIHWAFTKNAEAGEMKVYRNGMLWLSGTGLARTMTGVTSFELGAKGEGNFWNGSMDEFQLYNRELSQDEILWLAGITNPIDKPF